jgi:uncharacterized protein YecT (DUF1311 family)
MDPDRPRDVPRGMRKVSGTTLALIGALIVLVLVVAYFASTRNPDQDKLTGNELAQSGPQPTAAAPEKTCASKSTYDLIKRELFRRAAQLRGSDQGAFDQLSAYAIVRMENPVMESQDKDTGAVNCSGSLSLDLPPGVAVVGGRHSLTSDIDYTVQPAADGSGPVVLLRNAEAIVAPLATLARVNPPVQPVTAPMETNQAAPVETNGAVSAPAPSTAAPAAPPPQAQPARPAAARPSFDCAKARTKSETEVCSDAGLATLDRNMAAQYGRAMDSASPEERALLRRTRDRFIGYRNRCPNRACIGEAYVGRMREIRDIMEGRWQPR